MFILSSSGFFFPLFYILVKIVNLVIVFVEIELNDLMELKGGKKKSSSSSSSSSKSLFYGAPLGYSIEGIRLNRGIKKFRFVAYSNVRILFINHKGFGSWKLVIFCCLIFVFASLINSNVWLVL